MLADQGFSHKTSLLFRSYDYTHQSISTLTLPPFQHYFQTLPPKLPERRVSVHTGESGNIVPESDNPDETSTPQPEKVKVSYRSVMTKDIIALLLSNLVMCLSSETLFSVYPLFAFTPIQSGEPNECICSLEIQLISSSSRTLCCPSFLSHRRGSILVRESNRRIPFHSSDYPTAYDGFRPRAAPESLCRTGFRREVIPDHNVFLAHNRCVLPSAELVGTEEGDGLTEWAGV